MVTKLKPEVKIAWVSALRSDKYKQGTGWLCQGGKHCCLGVLAELAVDDGVVTKHLPDGDSLPVLFDDAGGLPGPKIAQWATGKGHSPYTDWSPEVEYPNARGEIRPMALTHLNDDLKLSFAEIADLVEDQL